MRRSPPAKLVAIGAILTALVLVLGYLLIEGVDLLQEAQACESPSFEEALRSVQAERPFPRDLPPSHLHPLSSLLPWVAFVPGETPCPSGFHTVAPPLRAPSCESSPLRL